MNVERFLYIRYILNTREPYPSRTTLVYGGEYNSGITEANKYHEGDIDERLL